MIKNRGIIAELSCLMRARFVGVIIIIRFTVVGVVVAVICVVGGGSDLECALSTRDDDYGRRFMSCRDMSRRESVR